MHRRRLILLPLLFFAACTRPPPPFHNTDLTGATFGRAFALLDATGRQRALGDFRGKVVIVVFGYTACPDICPTTLARLSEVMRKLGKDAERVQVVFITLDPERDSAEHLAAFVAWFYPTFLGLRGDNAQTKMVSDEFRVFSARKEVQGGLGYVLDHSTGAYVYDPDGRLRLFVKDDADSVDIAADVSRLLNE